MADPKETSAKISFGFTKKRASIKLVKSQLREDVVDKTPAVKDYVVALEEKQIQRAIAEEEKKELIIPVIIRNNWRFPSQVAGSSVRASDDSTLDAIAAREILQDTQAAEGQNERKMDLIIPLFMQNQVPEGFETDGKLDVSLRPDESTLEDYEEVPVEEFGRAMLRGMGWNDGGAIGKTNKQVVKPIEVKFRPKGLGLGADRTIPEQIVDVDQENEPVATDFSKGTCVRIIHGSNKGKYGQVEGRDDDTARAIVKLAMSDQVIKITQYSLQIVTKQEYKKLSKVINKGTYDEYVDKNSINQESENGDLKDRKKRKDDKKHKRRHRSPSPSHNCSSESNSSKHRKKRHSSPDHKSNNRWVRAHLRVRFINKNYKHGKYFSSKVAIVSVTSVDSCICRTESGNILEDIPESWLETVIPRTSPANVMIVKGRHAGQLGEIVEKDKKKSLVSVQLRKDRHQTMTLDYGEVCEYLGDI